MANEQASIEAHSVAGAAAGDPLAALARAASIETSTRNVADVAGYPALLAPGTDVHVTFLAGMPYHHVLSTAVRLRQAGLNPVPHLAARRFASAAALADFVARLRSEPDVRKVLLIAGDSESAAGPFASSVEALESGVFEAGGIRQVSVAGHPEGHRRIPAQALDDALDRKLAYARAHGIELAIVTQFCFDAQRVLDWVERLRQRGIDAPVRVGVAGPASVRTLLAYGVRCGIGASIRALGAGPVSLPRLLAHQGPDRIARAIAPRAAALGITGLHVFALGDFAESARWIADAAAGRLAPAAAG